MRYVTRRSQLMQKLKFSVTCPGMLFMETTPGPPKHEKYCVDVLLPSHIEKHHMTPRSHRMEKHKFGITFPGALLSNAYRSHPSMKNSATMF
jgi:hypothetical protein